MEFNDAPEIWALPHPVRIDAAIGLPMETLLFERLGVMDRLKAYLTDEQASMDWIVNRVPGMRAIGEAHFGLIGAHNMGSFVLTLARARLRAHHDPIVQLTPALQAMLAETDLSAELPAAYLRSPYPFAYLAFARPNALRVANQTSGLHECEGVYLGSYELPPGAEALEYASETGNLNLDPGKPARLVEIVVTGSPVGKRHPLDDSSQNITLLIQDEDERLQDVIERHLAWYGSPQAYCHPGMKPLRVDDLELIRPVVDLLAKALLYLNLSDAEKRRVNERSDLERRRKGLGQKKQARLQRKLATAYDRIVIGPASVPAPEEPQGDDSTSETPRSVKAHWRRGHFRSIRYGEKLGKQRLGWIKPVLVNADQAFEPVKTKPYVVR
jgi:hypothetical protein